MALDPAQGDPAHLGAVQGFEHVIGLLRAHHADHELQGSPLLFRSERRAAFQTAARDDLSGYRLPAMTHTAVAVDTLTSSPPTGCWRSGAGTASRSRWWGDFVLVEDLAAAHAIRSDALTQRPA